MTAELLEKLKNAGVEPDERICCETLDSLLGAGELDEAELAAVGDRVDFYDLAARYARRMLERHIRAGVRVTSADGIVISPFAKIGAGTTLRAPVELRSGAVIGADCVIGPCSVVENSTVGDGCIVNATQIYDSVLEENVKIGPFCHVRPNSHLCAGVKIGDFVEVKNSRVGRDTHASHLTYIGDSDVGERVNFGCGVVTVNYDGINKHRCEIGDDAFIGCNTNLVAPVKLGKGAYTAAGSTVTRDVPGDALAIARARQVNMDGWRTKHDAMQKEKKR